MKIKLSDFVIRFLKNKGVKTFFTVSGGASLHLINSVKKDYNLQYVCNHHEQAAACAADGYARTRNNIGCAIVTSGPGATNLVTGIASSFFDSIPVIYLTGQTSSKRTLKNSNVRQIGFQETKIIDIVKSITKYSVKVEDPYLIEYYLEKAYQTSLTDRRGPVLIDIPDDYQYKIIDTNKLKKKKIKVKNFDKKILPNFLDSKKNILNLVNNSKKPLLILGWGIILSETHKDIFKFSKRFNIPYCPTWAVSHLANFKDKLNVGTFGTHGNRHSNIVLEKADLLICLGTRLDTKATGSPIKDFSKNSKKIIFDVDINELNKFKKFGLKVDLLIQDNLKNFSKKLRNLKIKKVNNSWLNEIDSIKNNLDKFDEKERNKIKGLNPYELISYFSNFFLEKTNIFCDTGCIIAWINQKFRFKKDVNLYHDYNNTSMGWSLPASIGSYFHTGKKTFCFIGDGALMMCLNELATIQAHKIPIVIFIINNKGYSMIRQTQKQWFKSDFFASSKKGGITFPNFKFVAKSFNIDYKKIKNISSLKKIEQKILKDPKPLIVDIDIHENAGVIPQVKYGFPNFDMEPLLKKKEIEKITEGKYVRRK